MLTKLSLTAATLLASAVAHPDHHGSEVIHRRVGGDWFQPRDSPVHALFGRQNNANFPAIGTPEWTAGYPPALNSVEEDKSKYTALANIKPEWKAALDEAVKAGKIPNVPLSTEGGTYPAGTNPADKSVCAAVVKSCRIDGDLWDAPDGVYASSFDDGPTTATPALLQFLQQNKVTTTHFMIGFAIITAPDIMKQVVASGNDLAVHSWTHRQMTTLPNEQVVGELGWTMQIIYNSTNGKLPMYWRPPTGDTDARVSAIAREVFGMTTVIWNNDSEDWQIGTSGGPTEQEVQADVKKFITASPKTPGQMVLEHELTDQTVRIFMNSFPDIASSGWKFQSLASAYGTGAYQNDSDTVKMFGNVLPSGASSSGSSAAPGATGGASSKPGSPATTSTATNSSGNAKTSNAAPQSMSLSLAASFTALLLSAGFLLAN
jgi:peptidoglycan/xylan/chitin deacetylase (PgdA/CDA1 family)